MNRTMQEAWVGNQQYISKKLRRNFFTMKSLILAQDER